MEWPASIDLFLSYLAESSTLIAVVIPALLSFVFLYARKPGACAEREWQVFLLGTFVTIAVSFWRETEELLALHLLPGYPLILVLARAHHRPHPLRAYALCYLSLLCADLLCAWLYMGSRGRGWSADIYLGIGGAGAGDALFIVPPLCAITLALLDRAERSELGHQPLREAMLGCRDHGSKVGAKT